MTFEIFQRGGSTQFPRSTEKLVRVSKTGILLLNKAAFMWLGSESALLLFDRETHSVAIRSCSPETEHAVTVQLRKAANRISVYAFLKWIGCPIPKVYKATANEESRQLEFTVEYASKGEKR